MYQGKTLAGDPSMRPTKKWNRLFLKWFLWKKLAILKIAMYPSSQLPSHLTIRIGCRTHDGKTHFSAPIYDHDVRNSFGILIGHEDQTVFAIDARGRELDLMILEVTERGESHSHELQFVY